MPKRKRDKQDERPEELPDETRESESVSEAEREIADLKAELMETNAKWLRALADLDNYRKRIDRERSRWIEAAREDILLSLLDVVDSVERAIVCDDAGAPPPDNPYRQGVELILKSLEDVLEKNGVRAIDTGGVEFDPAVHEAVGHVESEDHESNQIIQEMRKGYTLGGNLLRCSRVVVAK